MKFKPPIILPYTVPLDKEQFDYIESQRREMAKKILRDNIDYLYCNDCCFGHLKDLALQNKNDVETTT